MALKRQIEELKQELSEHAEIFHHLQSVSEPEVVSVVRRLRSTPNASTVLASLRGAAHTTVRPSELKTLRGTLPPTDFETEFELSMLHSSVYPVLQPLDLDSFDIDSFVQPALRRLPQSSASVPPSTVYQTEEGYYIAPCLTILPAAPLRRARSPHTPPVAGPVPDRQYCDWRLNHLNISYWTCIPTTNEYAASVLSHYLETDHPMFACVDVDLFLSGLVDRTLEHCSPFLVSALMAFACVCYPVS